MTFAKPIPFIAALEKLRARGIFPAGWDSFTWSRMPVALRERAFFSSRVESARLLQSMHDYLGDFLANTRMADGGLKAHSRAEFVADMRELAIREGLGKINPETGGIDPRINENDLTDIRSLRRLQLIFDTQTEAAQEYGYFQQGQDPDILDVFPAQRFIRVRPVRVPRPYHDAALGEVRRKDDLQFWLSLNRDFGVPWGPWGFSSGCGVEDVDRDEAVALGVMREDDVVRPVDKEFNQDLSAGTRDLNGDLAAALARATGGDLAGDRLKAREQVADSAPKMPRPPGVMEPVPVPSRKSPASAKIEGLTDHPEATVLGATATVLDSVHDDGGLSPVPLLASRSKRTVGKYGFSQSSGKPLGITISTVGPWPELTMLHETAHWIDQQVFGGRDGFGTQTGKWGQMHQLLTGGETAREIRRMIRTERRHQGGPRDLYPWMVDDLKRMLKPEEMFARGYTQWITRKSAHPRLELLLQTADAHYFGIHNLKDPDFAKFDQEITNQFIKLGWLTNKEI